MSFATALRREVVAALCLQNDSATMALMEYAEHYALSLEPGSKARYVPLLQAWGAFRRSEDPNYWVDKARRSIRVAVSEGKRVVFDDVRYDNERQMLIEEDVVMVYVDSPARTEKPDHESERDWKNWPVGRFVSNTGTIEEYLSNLDLLVGMVLV